MLLLKDSFEAWYVKTNSSVDFAGGCDSDIMARPSLSQSQQVLIDCYCHSRC